MVPGRQLHPNHGFTARIIKVGGAFHHNGESGLAIDREYHLRWRRAEAVSLVDSLPLFHGQRSPARTGATPSTRRLVRNLRSAEVDVAHAELVLAVDRKMIRAVQRTAHRVREDIARS